MHNHVKSILYQSTYSNLITIDNKKFWNETINLKYTYIHDPLYNSGKKLDYKKTFPSAVQKQIHRLKTFFTK